MSALFADAPAGPFSLEEQIKEVEREITMRERCYPDWISTKRMTQGTSDRQLGRMRAVLRTLQVVKESVGS